MGNHFTSSGKCDLLFDSNVALNVPSPEVTVPQPEDRRGAIENLRTEMKKPTTRQHPTPEIPKSQIPTPTPARGTVFSLRARKEEGGSPLPREPGA